MGKSQKEKPDENGNAVSTAPKAPDGAASSGQRALQVKLRHLKDHQR